MSLSLLYVIWLLFPLGFFLMALWSFLEKATNRRPGLQTPGEHFKQGLFVLACVGVCIATDQYLLAQLVEGIANEWLPLPFFQVILLPFVLFVGAKLLGPTKDPTIKSHRKGGPK